MPLVPLDRILARAAVRFEGQAPSEQVEKQAASKARSMRLGLANFVSVNFVDSRPHLPHIAVSNPKNSVAGPS